METRRFHHCSVHPENDRREARPRRQADLQQPASDKRDPSYRSVGGDPRLMDEFEKDPATAVAGGDGAGDQASSRAPKISNSEKARSTDREVPTTTRSARVAQRRNGQMLQADNRPASRLLRRRRVAVSLNCENRMPRTTASRACPPPGWAWGTARRHQDLMDEVGPAYAKGEIFFHRPHVQRPGKGWAWALIKPRVPDAELDAYVTTYCKRLGERERAADHARSKAHPRGARRDSTEKARFGRTTRGEG